MASNRKISTPGSRMAVMAIIALMGGAPTNLPAEKAEQPESESNKTVFKWEAQSISQKLPATGESAEAWFFLTNPGTETRTILKVESDCDCITAELDRKRLHPGESAVLVATFHPGNRVGPVSKSIRVISRGKKETSDTDPLSWDLLIESPVRIQAMPSESDDSRRSYRVESRVEPTLRLKVPDDLSGILRLEQTEAAGRWLLTADVRKPTPLSEPTSLYLIALLPDGLRKHIPVPPTPR